MVFRAKWLQRKLMTIRYRDGNKVEATILARTEASMRVAVNGCDDVVQLRHLHGTWVTDDCEPVAVEFAWSRAEGGPPVVTIDDCICSRELAARLLQMFLSPED